MKCIAKCEKKPLLVGDLRSKNFQNFEFFVSVDLFPGERVITSTRVTLALAHFFLFLRDVFTRVTLAPGY